MRLAENPVYRLSSLASEARAARAVDRVNHWTLHRLTELNRDFLAGHCPLAGLVLELNRSVLGDLPPAESFSPERARQMVVLLGLVGASLGRQYQQHDAAYRVVPERAFELALVGSGEEPFRAYFAALADRTGTGHCHRDAYASLVRWNLPPTELWWAGERVAALPSAFDDGLVRTYTGAPGERRLFELLKLAETVERAINLQFVPICGGELGVLSDEARDRTALAAVLLGGLRRIAGEVAGLAPDESMGTRSCMDMVGGFAVHWTLGDLTPSVAMRVETASRDLLIGPDLDQYGELVRLSFPVLLDEERARLMALLGRPSLVQLVHAALSLEEHALSDLSTARMGALVAAHPILAALYLVLTEQAKLSGAMRRLTRRHVSAPEPERTVAGRTAPEALPGGPPGGGRTGSLLSQLTLAWQHHPLTPVGQLPAADLDHLSGYDRLRAKAPDNLHELVRFA
jgi:hypothetical protein